MLLPYVYSLSLDAVKGADFPRARLLPHLHMHSVSCPIDARDRQGDGRRVTYGDVCIRIANHPPSGCVVLLCRLGEGLLAIHRFQVRSQVRIGPGIVLVSDGGVVLITRNGGTANGVDSKAHPQREESTAKDLSLIHISEPTRLGMISYAVF